MPHERISMVSVLCCWILLICPPKILLACLKENASFRESMEILTVEEGEDVVLRASCSQPSFITWNFEKHLIAVTRPGQSLQLEKYSYRYPRRLSSSSDGSLVITGLAANDGQVYRADLFDADCGYLCVQVYDVRINESAGISPNVDAFESCGPTEQLLHLHGENITLKVPNRPDFAHIAWDVNNIDHIAITRPGAIVYRQNLSYDGKVSAMGDGSLRLSNLTTKDQQVYRAEMFTNKWGHLCTQHYDVRVKKISQKLLQNVGLLNHIRLALSACILLITISILIYHFKTECSRTRQ